MGKTRWTAEQQSAIYEEGTNILVSAGAGSGKTAVLTERIIEKLKAGISLDELVVLTFTNAAAFEMKERVRSKLKEAIGEGNTHLRKELDHLDNAFICTFDSFSLSLVRKYHYLLGIDKNVKIGDSIVLEMQKKQIMEEVFNSFFDGNEAFLKFVDTFATKDEKKLVSYLLTFSKKLEALYHKEEYLNTYLEEFYKDEKIEKRVEEYIRLIEKNTIKIREELEKIECKIGDPLLLNWYEKLRDLLSPLEKAKSMKDFFTLYPSSLPSLPSSQKIDADEKDDIKVDYARLKKAFEEGKALVIYENEDAMKEEIEKTKETVSVIIEVLKEFDKRVLSFKKKNSLFEFSDIGRFGVEILEKYPEIQKEYRSKIKEIMIDEYQDTNDIGDYFISLIASDNIYMVGDVKQSIYGFRNANPSLFMEKYDAYAKKRNGLKIDLMKNFRSREEVLTSINMLFLKWMDIQIGGADYPNGHEMIFGNKMYEKENTHQNQMLELRTYKEDKKYRKEEIEAFLIGQDIKEKVQNKYLVLDKEKGLLRPATYSDFTILMDRKTAFELYKKIFTYLHIPLYLHKDENFMEANEIYVIKSIVSLLCLTEEKRFYDSSFAHAFLSLARSFLYTYSDEQIFDVFLKAKEKNQSLYTTIKEDPTFEEMVKKIESILTQLPKLSLSEVIKEIYQSFSFYEKIQTLGNVELIATKLTYLLEVSSSLEEMGYTIREMKEYLESASKEKLDVSFSIQAEGGNTVSLMTIHKSKGLEFPICYYAGLYKTFSKEDFKDRFLWNQKYGFVVPVFDEGLKDTIYKTLVKEAYKEKDISEKIRLFYVALTRAKEKMILVSPELGEAEDYDKVPAPVRLEYRSFKDMLESISPTLRPFTKSISLSDIGATKEYEQASALVIQEEKKGKRKIDTFEVNLTPKRKENHNYSAPSLVANEKTREKLEMGKQIHTYFENIPFLNREAFYEKYEVSAYYREKIEAFFRMPFLPDLEKAEVYKEYSFIDEEGKMGIIDLLLETGTSFIVIDYKLKEIEKESYEKQVASYMKYIKELTGKDVEGYLYSILDESYKKIAFTL